MSLLTAGGLGWMTSKGPFQPKPFYDSMIDDGPLPEPPVKQFKNVSI